MGVYVKGIKPPSACAGCPCYDKPYFGLYGSIVFATCVLTNNKVDWNGCGKPEWCPILEIKTPHGRLIDENEVMRELESRDIISGKTLQDFLLEAKTLIEAEVENAK